MGLISFLGSQVEMALTRFLTKMLKVMASTSSLVSRVVMAWISSLVKTVEEMVWTSSSVRPIILNIQVRQVSTSLILMMSLPRMFPRKLFPKMILRQKILATIRRLKNRKVVLT